jgi:uncharacterized protein
VNLITYPSPDALLERIGPTLEGEEAKHSLILGILASFERRAYSLEGSPVLIAVENGGELVAAAVMTPPFPLILAATRDRIPTRAIYSLADNLWTGGHPVSGITADPWIASEFANAWERLSGFTRYGEMQQRIYRLKRLTMPVPTNGDLRLATEQDMDLVGRWMTEFTIEAMEEDDPIRSRDVAAKRIAQGEMYLWEQSGPRSMVGKSRPTRATITVNAVYTPPDMRGRGHATAAVAALSQSLLAEGYRECVLYTDLANPTSNRIYVRIGYEPVCDSVRYLFGQQRRNA